MNTRIEARFFMMENQPTDGFSFKPANYTLEHYCHDFGLSVRTRNCIIRAGIEFSATIDEVFDNLDKIAEVKIFHPFCTEAELFTMFYRTHVL